MSKFEISLYGVIAEVKNFTALTAIDKRSTNNVEDALSVHIAISDDAKACLIVEPLDGSRCALKVIARFDLALGLHENIDNFGFIVVRYDVK